MKKCFKYKKYPVIIKLGDSKMVMITLYARQKKTPRCIEWTF